MASRLQAVGLSKTFHKGRTEIPVLLEVDLEVEAGQFLAVIGASGSGKSTLLHLLGLLDRPDLGAIYLDGSRVDDARPRQRDRLRNRTYGFIFQFYHLLPELSTLENVMMPELIRHEPWGYLSRRRAIRRRAEELLERVGLGHRLSHRPTELSGGEMQRAAIARALLAEPEILLADEPTGNLDVETGADVFALLRDLNREHGLTMLVVTHDHTIAQQADRIVQLQNGRIEEGSLVSV